jgi:hypothetical protein
LEPGGQVLSGAVLRRARVRCAEYRACFGAGRVLVVATESLKAHRVATLDTDLLFAGVAPIVAQLDAQMS